MDDLVWDGNTAELICFFDLFFRGDKDLNIATSENANKLATHEWVFIN